MQTLTPIVVPLLVQQFVGEAQKATYYGDFYACGGLMLALLCQALWGLLSDHSASRWGRRRPFILGGTLFNVVLCPGDWPGRLDGRERPDRLLGCFLECTCYFKSLIMPGKAPAQGFIPDLVPADHVGRVSAVKTLLEVPLPVIFVSTVIAPLIVKGNTWGGILTACAVLAFSTLIAMFVREKTNRRNPPAASIGARSCAWC